MQEIREENQVLTAAGARIHAEAREKLLVRLVQAAEDFGKQTVSVEQAAAMTGWDPETIRRKVRGGELTDLRETRARGSPMRLFRHELDRLETPTTTP